MRAFLFKSGENLVLVGKRGGLYTPGSNPKVFTRVREFVHAPYRMILDGEYVPGEGIHFFDLIQVDNRDVRSEPLEKRREVLSEIIDGMDLSTQTGTALSKGEILKLRDMYASQGHEGVIVKNPKSKYGEPNSWLELNPKDTVFCFVTNVEERDRTWNWSLGLLDNRNGKLVDMGRVDSHSERIKPRNVAVGSIAEIKYHGIDNAMKLVEPLIVRIRSDIAPSECLLSQLDSALSILEKI